MLKLAEQDHQTLLDERLCHQLADAVGPCMAANTFEFDHSSHLMMTAEQQPSSTASIGKDGPSQQRQDTGDMSAPSFMFGQEEVEDPFSSLTGNDMWDLALNGSSSWALMPPISQLEMLPLQFNGSNILS